MRIEAVEIRQLEIPMIEPLAAAHGSTAHRTTILLRVLTDVGEGWGECVALPDPTYMADWSNGEYTLLSELFIPTLIEAGEIQAADVRSFLHKFKSHHTSKAALELAVLDAELRSKSKSLAEHFGAHATTIECSVVVGLMEGDSLIRTVERHLARGYRQVKLKIEPGHDIDRIDALRKHFPDLELRVDANGSYDWWNPHHQTSLLEVDARNLAFIEQPTPPGNARMFYAAREHLNTPLALDESVISFTRAMDLLDFVGCEAMVLKPGIVGGYLTAKEVHDECFRRNVASMLGGMLETGVARAANLALAALPGFGKYPAEIAPDGRWFPVRVLKEEVAMTNGCLPVPTGHGLGVEVDMQMVNRLTRRMHTLHARNI